jgi:hypothetical protein
MTVALACTWTPRGEWSRLNRLLPLLTQTYIGIFVAVRPEGRAEAQRIDAHPQLHLFEMPAPGWGRYLAIQQALAAEPAYIHYVDLDLLVHWLECQPEEWRASVELIQQADCSIIGRSARAFQSRPQAIQQTEQIINLVFSHIFGQPIDFGLGVRSYSRRAAQYIVDHNAPGRWGDVEWPLLIKQAGLSLAYHEADGVDWETPDRYRDQAADAATRQRAAEAYDQDARHWAMRVQIAHDIIQQGFEALQSSPEQGEAV